MRANLLNTLCILPNSSPNLFEHFVFVGFGGELNEEVTSVHLEHASQKFGVGHFFRVYAIAISAWAGVNPDVASFFGGESVQEAESHST